MAHGMMWTYDGQTVATPTFLLGTGPAGNLVSTVVDLSRFLSFLFARGASPQGNLIKPETLRAMIEPQLAKPGESPGFGLGFAISKLEKERTDWPWRGHLRVCDRGAGPDRTPSSAPSWSPRPTAPTASRNTSPKWPSG